MTKAETRAYLAAITNGLPVTRIAPRRARPTLTTVLYEQSRTPGQWPYRTMTAVISGRSGYVPARPPAE